MSKIAIFASGTGSNTEQIIRFLKKKKSVVQIAAIVCNKPNAKVVQIAEKYDIESKIFTNQQIERSVELISFLKAMQVEWIVLAGFLRKITSPVVSEYKNRILNLHPSLLPKYGGKGMYGNHVHKAVLQANESESGISIHLVNNEFDKGEILFQAKCAVKKGQTLEELVASIRKLEHQFFPKVIEETILSNR